jgi:CubicO group peptidase (beta-lactamase class C family)
VLDADTASTTVEGTQFLAPARWSIRVAGPATILTPPEPGNWIALVDVHAPDRDAALAAAWAAVGGVTKWPLQLATPRANADGWTDQAKYAYLVPPNERRSVTAWPSRAGDTWTVAIEDLSDAVAEQRKGEITLVWSRLLPKGFARETFAGRAAHELDAPRLAELSAFVESARAAFDIPGVAVGVAQHGRVVMARGFGVRALGEPARVDEHTLFLVASSTKALTTLLLAKLVEAGKVTWDTRVVDAWPAFALGDAATTGQVLVKHLVCACTGLPRQDLEWWFEFDAATPASRMQQLAAMAPTTKFGAAFQYSNLMAAAAGFLGAHLLAPQAELGAGYDAAMARLVFQPLGMTATTFDFARALRGNHATPHAADVDGRTQRAVMEENRAVVAMRPSGGAWSNVADLMRYVQMELARGALPGGKRYIAEAPLLARRAPQVAIGKDQAYGMGLVVDTTWGTPVVYHDGSMVGFKSAMYWLPEHDAGLVILTNANAGKQIAWPLLRKLTEVLFDGHAEASSQITAAAARTRARAAAYRARIAVPAEAAEAAKLAPRYHADRLGDLAIRREGDRTIADIGEWRSELASIKNGDGTVSFTTIAPGVDGTDFVVGPAAGGKRTLVVRDGQHEYVFTER